MCICYVNRSSLHSPILYRVGIIFVFLPFLHNLYLKYIGNINKKKNDRYQALTEDRMISFLECHVEVSDA